MHPLLNELARLMFNAITGTIPTSSTPIGGTQTRSRIEAGQSTCRKKQPFHKLTQPLTPPPLSKQFRSRPANVHWLQLRSPRDQDLHVLAGLALQVVKRRRARGRLRPFLPAYSPDQLVRENEEEGGLAEQER